MSTNLKDVSGEDAQDLRDRLGWTQDPQEAVPVVVMRLCEIVEALECRVIALEQRASQAVTP